MRTIRGAGQGGLTVRIADGQLQHYGIFQYPLTRLSAGFVEDTYSRRSPRQRIALCVPEFSTSIKVEIVHSRNQAKR